MSATTERTWRWSDHWRHGHPDGWDGRHELMACGYGTVFETAGVILTCSCGREIIASDDSDDGGPVSLTALNELAAAHTRGGST